jgi:HEAT repeat protein
MKHLRNRSLSLPPLLLLLAAPLFGGCKREGLESDSNVKLDKEAILRVVKDRWCILWKGGGAYPHQPGRCPEAAKLVAAVLECKRRADFTPAGFPNFCIGFVNPRYKIVEVDIFYHQNQKVAEVSVEEKAPIFFELSPELCNAFEALDSRRGADIPGFIQNLDVKDSRIQRGSIWALEDNGEKAKAALPKLRALLSEQNLTLRYAAARAAYRIGAEPEALKVLFRDFAGPPGESQEQAGATLEQLADRLGKEHLPALRERLRDPDKWIRCQAAEILAEMRTKAKPAIPDLLQTIKDPAPEVRGKAALALGRTKEASDPVMKALIQALSDSEWEVQRSAIWGLDCLGPQAKAALPTLKRLLLQRVGEVMYTARAILSIDPSDEEAKAVLKELGHIDVPNE